MSVYFDPILGELTYHKDNTLNSSIKTSTSTPSTGKQGDLLLNSTTLQILVYNGSVWEVLHTLSATLDYMLQENGDFLLQENGDKIIL